MSFGFATASEILFGPGCLKKTLATAKKHAALGTKALVVCDNVQRASPILDQLTEAKIPYTTLVVQGEPTDSTINSAAAQGRANAVDFVIGFGGGSVMDTAKAVAMLVTNGGKALDYLEVIGQGLPITKKSLPVIAIATTAGTGAEVTKNAVVKSEKHHQKASLRAMSMFPTLAVVDPELMLTVPPHVTAAAGLDAFTQCLEPFTSHLANPITDALAVRGLQAGAAHLRTTYTDGKNIEARTAMALCSLLGGLCLSNAKLGSVHGFAGVLGGMLADAPHGGICGALMPACIAMNVKVMRERDPNNPAIEKYCRAARIVLGRADATPEDLSEWVAETCAMLNVPPLSKYGLRPVHFPEAVRKSSGSSSMKGNPIKLTSEELTAILRQACSPALVSRM